MPLPWSDIRLFHLIISLLLSLSLTHTYTDTIYKLVGTWIWAATSPHTHTRPNWRESTGLPVMGKLESSRPSNQYYKTHSLLVYLNVVLFCGILWRKQWQSDSPTTKITPLKILKCHNKSEATTGEFVLIFPAFGQEHDQWDGCWRAPLFLLVYPRPFPARC